jgi:hypothetical protein
MSAVEETIMGTACDCGMTLEHHDRHLGCTECGTRCCPSCSLEFDATPYCRWCATSTGLALGA